MVFRQTHLVYDCENYNVSALVFSAEKIKINYKLTCSQPITMKQFSQSCKEGKQPRSGWRENILSLYVTLSYEGRQVGKTYHEKGSINGGGVEAGDYQS